MFQSSCMKKHGHDYLAIKILMCLFDLNDNRPLSWIDKMRELIDSEYYLLQAINLEKVYRDQIFKQNRKQSHYDYLKNLIKQLQPCTKSHPFYIDTRIPLVQSLLNTINIIITKMMSHQTRSISLILILKETNGILTKESCKILFSLQPNQSQFILIYTQKLIDQYRFLEAEIALDKQLLQKDRKNEAFLIQMYSQKCLIHYYEKEWQKLEHIYQQIRHLHEHGEKIEVVKSIFLRLISTCYIDLCPDLSTEYTVLPSIYSSVADSKIFELKMFDFSINKECKGWIQNSSQTMRNFMSFHESFLTLDVKKKSADLIEQQLALNPRSTYLLFMAGVCYYNLRRYEASLYYFQRLAYHKSQYRFIELLIIFNLLQLKRVKEALQIVKVNFPIIKSQIPNQYLHELMGIYSRLGMAHQTLILSYRIRYKGSSTCKVGLALVILLIALKRHGHKHERQVNINKVYTLLCDSFYNNKQERYEQSIINYRIFRFLIRFGYDNNILNQGRHFVKLINRLIDQVEKRNAELAGRMREGLKNKQEDDMELLIIR